MGRRPLPPIVLPRPDLRFPEPGWRKRLEACVAAFDDATQPRGYRVTPGAAGSDAAVAGAEAELGRPLPRDLRKLLLEVDGLSLRFDDVVPLAELAGTTEDMRAWQEHELFLQDVPLDDITAFAMDGCENYYGLRSDETAAQHRVVYFCHDPPGWEHRFTSLGTFLESALVRARAQSLWWAAETAAGAPVDPAPWTAATLALELEIDPGMLRTRED